MIKKKMFTQLENLNIEQESLNLNYPFLEPGEFQRLNRRLRNRIRDIEEGLNII